MNSSSATVWTPGDEGGGVALGSLHEAAAAGGQVERHARQPEGEAVEVDDVEVGAHAGRHQAAVAKAEQLGGLARLAVDDVLERELRAPPPVAGPVGEHERGRAAVADRAAVGAGVGEAHPRVRVLRGLVGHRQVAVAVVEERRVDHAVAVLAGELVDEHLHGRHAAARPPRPRPRCRRRARSRCRGRRPATCGPTLSSTTRWKKPPSSGISCTQPTPALGLGEGGQPRRHRQVGDLGVGGVEQQRVHAPVEAVEDADRAAGHLGDDVEPVAPARRSSWRSTWRHTSGSWSGWLRFTLTVRPERRARSAIHGHSWIGTRAWSGANWNTPCPARASASPMAEQLVGRRVGAGHELAVLGAVERGAAGGEARARRPAAPPRPASAIRTASSAVAGSLAAPRSPITKARSGPWAIWAPTSSTFGLPLDGVEVLREARPLPRDALGHGRRRGCPRRPPSARSATRADRAPAGAKPTPQLPITTVVTPCHELGVTHGSQVTWAS